MRRIYVVAMLCSLLLPAAYGQNRNSGEIRGTVTDPTQAPVADVRVILTNTLTAVVTQLKTNASGSYDALSVTAGDYRVEFIKEGFRELVREGITLHVETITIDGTLQLGSVTEQVKVESGVELVQTETSDRRMTLTSETVSELPNVGRSWFDLTGQIAGVNPGVSSQGNGQDASGENIGVNGVSSYQTNWLVDGGVGTFPVSQNPDLLRVPVDDIAEVNFLTSNVTAEFGNGPSVFNVITKSGTNQFHGSLFEFVQNDYFAARNFFSPTVTPIRWNDFGGTVGGPIKKDKLFFFFSIERNPTSSFSSGLYTFPTAQMRNGDFSQLSTTVYDPASTTIVNGNVIRTPLPGNKMNIFDINPVAAKIQSYYPLPNLPGTANNYYFSASAPTVTTWYNGKIDYDLSSSNRLTGSIMAVPQSNISPAPTCPMNCGTNDITESLGQVTDVWTINSSAVNEVRFSFNRESGSWSSPNIGAGYPAKIGLPGLAANAFPNINISGAIAPTLGEGLSAKLGFTSFEESDSLTLVRGRHTIKLGGELNSWRDNEIWQGRDAGDFTFSGVFTSNPSSLSDQGGVGYADFLYGSPSGWSVTNPQETGGRIWNAQMFVQDNYKIRPNLTLNLGVRYLIQPGWTEEHDRFSIFDPTIVNPATGTLGALRYAGEYGKKALERTVYDSFSPRIGFAWQPLDKWSVRGGYGIYDMMWGANTYTNGLGTGWTSQGSLTTTDQVTPVFSLSQGPPAPIYPSAATRTPDLLNGNGVSYQPYNTPLSYVQQWNFDIQRQLPGQTVVDVAYVGNHTVHLPFGRDIDQVPENLLGPGDAQSRRPYPQYYGIDAALFDGYSHYHALQVSARKQFSSYLSVIANYTFAKSLDTGTGAGWGGTTYVDTYQRSYDVAANCGPSAFDITHLFNGSVIYQLPVGKGKTFLSNGGWLNTVIGDWQISATFQLHSGTPFTPTMADSSSANALAGNLFPNRIGDGTLAHPTIQDWFDVSAFMQPAPYTFGDSGRNILRGPAFENVNLGIEKSFRFHLLGEASSLQLRGEAYDVLNHANFLNPNALIGNEGAGTISSSLTSRNLQLGLRLTF